MKIVAGMPWRLDWHFTGLSKRTLEFFQEVARQGGETRLYCAGPKITDGAFSTHPISVPERTDGGIWSSLLNSIAFSSRFAEKVEELEFDVLHCFNTSSLFLSGRPRLLQTLNPTHAYASEVMSREYSEEPQFRKMLGYYDAVAQLEEMEYEDSQVIVARSEAVKENIVKYHDIEAKRIRVVPDGLSQEEIARPPLPRQSGEMKVILFSGSVRIMKGFGCLIDAMEAVVTEVPDVVLVVAGRIYPPEKEIISRKISASSARKNVVMAGFLPPERYRQYLDLADVGCVPTIGHASLSILEYVAHGIPVVTTRFSGLQEIDRVGTEVPPGDAAATASAILQALTEPELRDRVAKNASKVLERHSWRVIVTDFMKLYGEVQNAYP